MGQTIRNHRHASVHKRGMILPAVQPSMSPRDRCLRRIYCRSEFTPISIRSKAEQDKMSGEPEAGLLDDILGLARFNS